MIEDNIFFRTHCFCRWFIYGWQVSLLLSVRASCLSVRVCEKEGTSIPVLLNLRPIESTLSRYFL